MGSIWARLGVAMVAIALVSSYQNCGQAPSARKLDDAQEQDHIVHAMGESEDAHAITSQKVNAEGQCRVENLRCIRKIYSPQVTDASGQETICIDGACLNVQTHSYNSRGALAACSDCGADAAAPGGDYNREEVTCWLGEPGQSSAQVFALRSTFEEAVRSTLAACAGEQQ